MGCCEMNISGLKGLGETPLPKIVSLECPPFPWAVNAVTKFIYLNINCLL